MKIIHGETLTIAVSAVDAGGATVAIGAGWLAALSVVRAYASTPILQVAMTIADGAASMTFDTGDAPWAAGAYRYDIRITDTDGNDYWTPVYGLTLDPRITGAS